MFIDPFFNIMQFLFPMFFLLIFGIVIFTLIKNIKEWSYNNKQPIVPVTATIVSKLTLISPIDLLIKILTLTYFDINLFNTIFKRFLFNFF